MDRRYLRSSSLARKFFDDFPEAPNMPLELMNTGQHRAYDQHVLPLLELFNSHPSLKSCCGAVKQLVDDISRDSSLYEQSRAAAEYIQSPFAICTLDAAAACTVHPLAAQFYRYLSACDSVPLDELLYEDIRRRLVANGLQDLTKSLAVQLDKHPAVAAATPHPSDLDKLVLPRDAAYSISCNSISSGIGIDTAPTPRAAAAGAIADNAGSAGNTNDSKQAAETVSADATAAAASPTILKRAAWRRQLSRLSSHYLAPILGKDGPGSVVLTGGVIADVLKGTTLQPAAVAVAAQAATSASSNVHSSTLDVSFVGYGAAAAAQTALDGCLKELITRWSMRHKNPLTDPQGCSLLPLAIAAQHHLLLLLPEPTQPQLPAAVHIDAAAMQAAVDHGAFEGPAVAAAAANAGQQITQTQGTGFRDVMFRFDLALHPSMEALLLSAAAAGDLVIAPAAAAAASSSEDSESQVHNAPVLLLAAANASNAFAYDGDDVYTLPSAVRALASGRTLVHLDAVTAAAAAACSESRLQNAGENHSTSVTPAESSSSSSSTFSTAGLMNNPAGLRGILDHSRYQQQQQQQAQGAQADSAAPAAATASSGGGTTDTERHRIVQQLQRDHEWVSGLVDRPTSTASSAAAGGAGGGAAQQQQQQAAGSVPEIVRDAMVSRWWKGPVMRGSVLYGADV